MKPTFNKKNSTGPSAAAIKASRIKVIKPSTPSSNMASYQFECELDADFLNNLALKVGVSEDGKVNDITDDLKLESFFLQQALASVVAGRGRLEACGRTFSRPPTYHAHLLKTVAHLQRIRRVEEEDRKSREASMDAKRQRLLKSTAKKVQQDTLQERQKGRSEERKKLEEIKKKAGKKSANNEDEDDGGFDVETAVENIISNKKVQKKAPLTKFNKSNANSKRQSKDKKFGFGGKDRKMEKRNTKDSVNDISGFAKANTKSHFGGVSKATGKGKGGKKGAAPKGGKSWKGGFRKRN